MDHLTSTNYKNYLIRAFERESARWRAEFRKADGREIIIIADGTRHNSITTSADALTADAAIELAKWAIDGGGIK